MKLTYLSPVIAMLLTIIATAHAGDPSHADEHGESSYIEVSELGNPADVLKVKTSKSIHLESGEVRVNVLAAPIHPSDLLQISGNYGKTPKMPYTPGNEGVGRVVETSAEVNHLAVGQLVLLTGGGTWREQVIAPAAQFIPLPDLGSPGPELIEQLAMTAVNPLAAYLMLTSFADLKEGDWLVQSAANSAVGGYLIQLAKQRGIKTVNVVRREGLADELKSKGADVVLIDGPNLSEAISEATGNAHISLALDAVGGATLPRLANSLGYGSTLVSYGVLSGKPATINPAIAISQLFGGTVDTEGRVS